MTWNLETGETDFPCWFKRTQKATHAWHINRPGGLLFIT